MPFTQNGSYFFSNTIPDTICDQWSWIWFQFIQKAFVEVVRSFDFLISIYFCQERKECCWLLAFFIFSKMLKFEKQLCKYTIKIQKSKILTTSTKVFWINWDQIHHHWSKIVPGIVFEKSVVLRIWKHWFFHIFAYISGSNNRICIKIEIRRWIHSGIKGYKFEKSRSKGKKKIAFRNTCFRMVSFVLGNFSAENTDWLDLSR